jgi:hypothetical protein
VSAVRVAPTAVQHRKKLWPGRIKESLVSRQRGAPLGSLEAVMRLEERCFAVPALAVHGFAQSLSLFATAVSQQSLRPSRGFAVNLAATCITLRA